MRVDLSDVCDSISSYAKQNGLNPDTLVVPIVERIIDRNDEKEVMALKERQTYRRQHIKSLITGELSVPVLTKKNRLIESNDDALRNASNGWIPSV